MPEPTDARDPFAHFDPEVPVPLPAADIRRRGDRLRRRNAGLAVAGAVAAIALVATPLAVLTGGDDTDALPPAGQSTTTVTDPTGPADPTSPAPSSPADLVTEIPDDFPLAAGLPETNLETGEPTEVVRGGETTDFALCQDVGFSPTTPSALTDVARVAYLGPEDGRQRQLTVWATVDGAEAAIDDVRDTLADCAPEGARYTEQTSSYDGDSTVYTVQYSAFGDFEQGDELATGLGVIEAVRVRNALYLARYDSEAGGSPEAATPGVVQAAEQSAEAVTAMDDVFDGDASGGDETGTTTTGPALLDLADLPDRGRLDAWSEDPDDTLTWACAQPGLFEDLDAEASVAVRYAAPGAGDEGGPAIARVRTAVLQLADDDGAFRAYDQLQDALSGCAEADDRFSPLGAGDDSGLGGDDVTWQGFRYGAPDICTDCDAAWFDRMGVARLGDRVVLVSYAEVGGPLEPDGLDQALRGVLQRAIELA